MELALLGVRRAICTVYRIAKSSYGEGKVYMKRIRNIHVFAFSGLLYIIFGKIYERNRQ